jgi:hypothetical protein
VGRGTSTRARKNGEIKSEGSDADVEVGEGKKRKEGRPEARA